MENIINYKRSPEEEELDNKLAELSLLEAKLAQQELELTTIQADLTAFEQQYQQVIGVRYAALEKLEAEITKYLLILKRKYSEPLVQTQAALRKKPESQQVTQKRKVNSEPENNSKSRERLKQLYREVAKRIHPDFTTDKAECLRRHNLMAEVNQAYKDGDEAQLEAILHKWQHSPESVQGEGIAADLIRTIRKIAQVREGLKTVEYIIESLQRSPLHQLYQKVITAQHQGRDLLAEMAEKIDEQMAEPKLRLEALKARIAYLDPRFL